MRFSKYRQMRKDNSSPNHPRMWKLFSDTQLSKCQEKNRAIVASISSYIHSGQWFQSCGYFVFGLERIMHAENQYVILSLVAWSIFNFLLQLSNISIRFLIGEDFLLFFYQIVTKSWKNFPAKVNLALLNKIGSYCHILHNFSLIAIPFWIQTPTKFWL